MRVSLYKSMEEFDNISVSQEKFVLLGTIKFFNYNGIDYEILDRKLVLSDSTLILWVQEI